MDVGLENKRVLITAGAAGIGLATARAFSASGAQVAVCDIDAVALESAAAAEPGLLCLRADVSDPSEVDQVFEGVLGTFGGLDVLVNNAGIAGPTGPIEDCEPDAWRQTIAVNLDGTYLCCRRAVPAMRQEGSGCIVNLSSTAGLHGYPLRTPYAAAKWGIVGLTKSLAMEAGPYGVRVNAICPGSVSGPRMDGVIAAEAKARSVPEGRVRDQYLRQTSLRCFVDAEEIADLILFLASPRGAKISGQALAMDGHTESLSQVDLNDGP